MAQQIFLKKQEKIERILSEYEQQPSIEELKRAFKSFYPDDWNKINARYNKHERKSKGKSFPMPHPEKYLENMFKVHLKKKKLEDQKMNAKTAEL